MKTSLTRQLVCASLISLAPLSMVMAQTSPDAQKANFDKSIAQADEGNWYFSWGYSRQQYAPSDIHVSQPALGNDFTVHQASGKDFPTTPQETIDSISNLDFTTPQENMRIGKFMNPEKTFAVEFSLDHTKYNVDNYQAAQVSGTINNQPVNGPLALTPQSFDYRLHNGLNHIMINAVWLHHLYGPEQKPGDLQLISRAGAGILLPHADNRILGNANQVGPKNQNVCCFKSDDWWQLNGWTAGVEVGLRYRVYKTMYVEATTKAAYGVLRGVPVYQGTADQNIWMTEQVVSVGFLF
jgi:hypothetical protein